MFIDWFKQLLFLEHTGFSSSTWESSRNGGLTCWFTVCIPMASGFYRHRVSVHAQRLRPEGFPVCCSANFSDTGKKLMVGVYANQLDLNWCAKTFRWSIFTRALPHSSGYQSFLIFNQLARSCSSTLNPWLYMKYRPTDLTRQGRSFKTLTWLVSTAVC